MKKQNIISTVILIVAAVFLGVLYRNYVYQSPAKLGAISIPESPYLFITSLQANMGTSDTSMTLNKGTLANGSSLTGYQCFTIDTGLSTAEYTCGTASGTAISSLLRGIDPQNPAATSSALTFAHRASADVRITDFPILQILKRLANGQDAFPNVLQYDSSISTTTIAGSSANLVNVGLLNSVAIAGAVNATTTIQGLVQFATGAQVSNGTLQGSTGAFLVTPNSFFKSSTQSATTVPVTGANGKLSQGFLDLSQDFTFTGQLINSSATTTLIATTSKPLILDTIAYAFPNAQGATSTVLTNNGQGVLTWSAPVTYKNGVSSFSGVSGSQTIAHGLGKTPSFVRIVANMANQQTALGVCYSTGVYNGSTTATNWFCTGGGAVNGTEGTDTTNIVKVTDTTNSYVATVTVDATNITLNWTKTASPGTVNFMWEVQ